ncbi:MAG TPA: hypothetical protein IAB09_06035 [Candidatus Avilachnospira avicola]|nr:hypothetical protein [Candidatus Avilachnospira avicola]
MINFKDEIQRFKPSLDVGDIEQAIAKSDLTDMSDIMLQLIRDAALEGNGSISGINANERL